MENRYEIWQSVKGYESSYAVSNLGKVKSLGRFCKSRWETPNYYPERTLLNRIDRYGYLKISLYGSDKIKHTTLHRLVADAFVPNPTNKPGVNHIDGDKLNNCADNLEWVTPKENIAHAEKMGLRNRVRNKFGQYA